MGMFTSITHPDIGIEIQIKTGCDDLETYHVGQKVNTCHDKNVWDSGRLLNGVYDGIGSRLVDQQRDELSDYWVVIKDGRIHAVVDAKIDDDEGITPTCEEVAKSFNVDPERDNRKLFTPGAYWRHVRHEKAELRKWARYKRSQAKHCEGMSKEERRGNLARIMCGPIRRALKYEAVGRRLLMVEPLPATYARYEQDVQQSVNELVARDPSKHALIDETSGAILALEEAEKQ